MGRGWQGPAAIRGDQAPLNRPSPPRPVPRGLPGACGALASLVQAWCRLCGSAFTPGLRSARSSVGGLGGAPTTPMGRETPGARGQQVSFPGEAGPEGRRGQGARPVGNQGKGHPGRCEARLGGGSGATRRGPEEGGRCGPGPGRVVTGLARERAQGHTQSGPWPGWAGRAPGEPGPPRPLRGPGDPVASLHLALGFQVTTTTSTASSTSGTPGHACSSPTRPSARRAPTTGSSSPWGPTPSWRWPTPSTARPPRCTPTCTCGWWAPSSSSSPSW